MNEKIGSVEGDIEKPPLMYHGSIEGTVNEFMPRSATERPTERPAIYASPKIEVAKQSMANRFVSNGGIVNGKRFVCIPGEREAFLKQDLGGYVYTLPGGSFSINRGMGLGDDEWVSHRNVRPLSVEYFPSLYTVLKQQGVAIYFIHPEQIEEIAHLQEGDPEQLEQYLGGMDEDT